MGSSVSKGKKQSSKNKKTNQPAPNNSPGFNFERVQQANLANKHYEPLPPKLIDTIQKEIQWKAKLTSGQLTCEDYNARAKDFEAQGQVEQAIVHYGLGVKADPSNVDNLKDLASLLREQKLWPMLIEIDHAIVRRQPGNADALFILAIDLFSSGGKAEVELAISYLHQVIGFNPNHESVYEALGVCYLSLARNEEALQAFQVAAQQRPQRALCHNNIGAVLWPLGRKDEAILAYQHAVELDPDLTIALRSLGGNLQEIGRNEEAIPVLQKLVQKDPQDATGWGDLGSALAALGRVEEAKEALVKSARLKIKDPEELARFEEEVKNLQA